MAPTPIRRRPVRILCGRGVTDEQLDLAIAAINDLTKFAMVALPIEIVKGKLPAEIEKIGVANSRVVSKKRQLGAHQMLDKMIENVRSSHSTDPHFEVFLTKKDIFGDDQTNWIFGVSQEDHAGVYSFNRFVGKLADETAKTVIMHEVGHVFSLPARTSGALEEKLGKHCTNRCLMRQGMSLAEMRSITEDRLAGHALCDLCRQDLIRYFWQTSPAKRNPDEETRQIFRTYQQDPSVENAAKLIHQRIRVGELPPEYIIGAGLLGHRAAQLVIPTHTRDWTQPRERNLVYDYLLRINPYYLVEILLDFVEQEMAADDVLINSNDTARARVIEEAPDRIREYLNEVDQEPGGHHGVLPATPRWVTLLRIRGQGYVFNSHTHCNSVRNILSLVQMIEDIRYGTISNRHSAAGAATGVVPVTNNKDEYRRQALFIANRLLNLS